MFKIVFALGCLVGLLAPSAASAWGYQGHRVVGSIADHLLTDNAKEQVKQILNPQGVGIGTLDLRMVGPWADCVRSVDKDGTTFKYQVNETHPDYELPCIPFKGERKLMEEYA